MATTPCSCQVCPNGIAQQWQLVISGIANANCTDCSNLNGTWVLALQSAMTPCYFKVTGGGTVCGNPALVVWELQYAAIWQLAAAHIVRGQLSASAFDGLGSNTFSLSSGPDCNFPATATVTAVGPALPGASFASCVAAMLGGTPPGSTIGQCLPPPYLGGPTSCAGGGGGGGCAGGGACGCGGNGG